jgi:hypothetical protein
MYKLFGGDDSDIILVIILFNIIICSIIGGIYFLYYTDQIQQSQQIQSQQIQSQQIQQSLNNAVHPVPLNPSSSISPAVSDLNPISSYINSNISQPPIFNPFAPQSLEFNLNSKSDKFNCVPMPYGPNETYIVERNGNLLDNRPYYCNQLYGGTLINNICVSIPNNSQNNNQQCTLDYVSPTEGNVRTSTFCLNGMCRGGTGIIPSGNACPDNYSRVGSINWGTPAFCIRNI